MELKYALCNKNFWNNFCSPRYPGVHIILALVLLDVFYTCVAVVMSSYFDNFSDVQHFGYLASISGNVIVIIAGFLSIHFLTLKSTNMRIGYCIFLHVAMIMAILLGIAAILLMLTSPSMDDLKIHVQRHIRRYNKPPYMMGKLFLEKKCCGIQEWNDIFRLDKIRIQDPDKDDEWKDVNFYDVPSVCCRRDDNVIFKECEEWTNKVVNETDFEERNSKFLVKEPCFHNGGGFDQVKSTETYNLYMQTVYFVMGIFPAIFGILVVLNYYIWCKFPQMPKAIRPIRFNEDIRLFVKCRWGQVRQNQEEEKRRRELLEGEILEEVRHKKGNDFAHRHEMMKQSLMNMRTLTRDQRIQKHLNDIHQHQHPHQHQDKPAVPVKSNHSIHGSRSSGRSRDLNLIRDKK